MRRLLFILTIGFILFVSATPEASAQRTSKGRVFVGLNQMVSVYSIPSGGLAVEAGQYLLRSYWKAGVSAVDWNQRYNNAEGTLEGVWFDHIHYTVSGGWMYRLLGSYSRTVSLYGGALAFLGVNSYRGFRPLPEEFSTGYPDAGFIYGAAPALELEVFPFRKVALVLGVHSPFTLSSTLETDLWHVTGSLGLRINL